MSRIRRSGEELAWTVLRWISIVVLVIGAAFPVVFMISMSMRPMTSMLAAPGRILPTLDEVTLEPYRQVLAGAGQGGFGFGLTLRNSFLVAGTTVVVSLVIASLASYAVTRMRLPGARGLNTGLVLVYLFPPLLFAVPLFVIFSRLGLRPSFVAVIVIYVALTLPLAMYMLRNYFRTVPIEIEEAARIDGAGWGRVLAHVVAPLSLPAVVTVGFYVFMSAWDEFLFALLFLAEDRDRWTAALAINQLENNVGTPTTVLLAGCVVVTVPLVLGYALAQRFLVEGMTAGGVKD